MRRQTRTTGKLAGLLASLTLIAALAACERGEPDAVRPAATGQAPQKENEAIAHISDEAAKTVGIVTAVAGPASIRETLPLYGVVKPNAERVREVIARFPGTVRTVSKVIGDTVKQGDTLATIESNESLQTYALSAPIGGIVTAREADPGEQAGSEVLFSIADPSTVWIELSLFPTDAVRVHAGQFVQIESIGGGLKGSGKIGLIGVYGQTAGQAPNQALSARVQIANPERRWTPGLFVNGAVELAKIEVPLAIAATAVQTLDGKSVVFVPVEGGYAARVLTLGRSDPEFVEVLAGLTAGEPYVAANSFIVKAELGKSSLEEDEASDPNKDDAPEPTR